MKLHNDLETRSTVDLKKSGVYVYAEHPATEILCWAYALDEGPVKIWYPIYQRAMPDDLRNAILHPDCIFEAHNAGFERILLTLVGKRFLPADVWAELRKVDRWSCTAARARVCGLPGALDLVATALNLRHKKDKEGYALMMKMCKPRGLDEHGNPVWFGNEADMLRLGAYCCQDVEVERTIDAFLPDFSANERQIWIMTERMNDRGVMVDQQMLMKLLVLAEDAVVLLNKQLREKTGGKVKAITDTTALRAWLADQGVEHIEDTGIGKAVLLELLEDVSLDPLVQEVLCLRRDGGKTSTAKFKSIAARMNRDQILRGPLIYCGASGTSRYTSGGAQLQNLPRNRTIKNLKAVVEPLLEIGLSVDEVARQFGPPMVVLSELLRPLFIARKGYWMARGDYSQVEARLLQFIAGATENVENFRKYDQGIGKDVYITTAAKMFSLSADLIEKDSEERQYGKVGVLAGGYGGGAKAFMRFARQNGLEMSEEEAEKNKVMWRDANPEVVQLWGALERAALDCMESAFGTTHEVRPGIWFKRNHSCMVMRLMSGEHLFFWHPSIRMVETPWGTERPQVFFWSEDNLTHKWSEFSAYGGLYTAMCVQKTARDVMCHALQNMMRRNLNPILTVHDEGIAEPAKSEYATAFEAAEAVKSCMLDVPDWCMNVPLAVDASAAERYIKG